MINLVFIYYIEVINEKEDIRQVNNVIVEM